MRVHVLCTPHAPRWEGWAKVKRGDAMVLFANASTYASYITVVRTVYKDVGPRKHAANGY